MNMTPETRRKLQLGGIGVAAGALAVFVLTAGFMLWTWREYKSVFTTATEAHSRMIYPDARMAGQIYFSPELNRIRRQLAQRPGDEQLRQEARRIELQLRRRFLTLKDRLHWGGWILLVSGALAIASGLTAASAWPRLPVVRGETKPAQVLGLSSALGGVATGALILGLGVGVYYAAVGFGPAVTARQLGLIEDPPPPIPPYSATDPTPAWPRFRGRHGNGNWDQTPAVSNWSFVGDENLVWQAEIDLPSAASPIISGNRVICLGANAETSKVYCFDTASGRLAWEATVSTPASDGAQLNLYGQDMDDDPYAAGMFAASTPVTDGTVICAIFPTGDVACFDMDGRQLWVRNIGPMDVQYGYVSSLAIHAGRLIIQHDRGGTDDEKSRLLLLEVDSGKTVAEVVRTGSAGSWASPIVIPVGQGHQIVAQGQGVAIAHDAETGQELWRVNSGVMDQALSPIWTGKYVVLSDTGGGSIAVDPTGRGDLTGTDKVAWQIDGGNGPVSTPATDGKIVVQQDGWGGLAILSAENGRKLGELMLPEGAYDPSPAIAAGRVYQFTRKGDCHVIRLADEPKLVTTNKLIGGAGDRLLTSPAFAGDRIYVRSLKYLYCIGETP